MSDESAGKDTDSSLALSIHTRYWELVYHPVIALSLETSAVLGLEF
jgi:hypothetical protein